MTTQTDNDEIPSVIVTTPAKLWELLRAAVRVELAATKPSAPAAMLSTRKAAELLGCSSRSVLNMIGRGELEGHRVGSAWRVRRSAVEAYLEAHRVA